MREGDIFKVIIAKVYLTSPEPLNVVMTSLIV